MATTLTLVVATVSACGRSAVVATPTAATSGPVWAVQMQWTPTTYAIGLQYDGANAYTVGTRIAAEPSWQRHTWELTGAEWRGTENFGADFRIPALPGVAIQQVSVGLKPPGQGGPQATAVLPGGGSSGALAQVGAGGTQGDSRYHVAAVAGREAEVLDPNPAAASGGPSYLYFRLSRSSPVFAAHAPVAYVTVTFAAPAAQAWPEATFAALAAQGITRAEINLEWDAIEPAPGRFDFTTLDQDLANAAAAGIRVIPIFWDAVWAGTPAYWLTARDIGSSGAASQVPIWWDPASRRAYFDYVQATVAHIRAAAGFGGAFLDYGWLDAMWGPGPGGTGVNGYAPADIARFHEWLPTAYGTLAAFNAAEHTAYSSWSQVPAAKPGQALFPIYQSFRAWSVQQTYAKLSALYRKLTQAPLYYYWGGSFGGAGVGFNLPDTFFQLARQYRGTVVLDDANVSALPPLFHSLAQAYGVPLLEEWTPARAGFSAEMAQFLGHYGFEGPSPAGLDFFLYNGGAEYRQGFPVYLHWLPYLRKIGGAYPQQPVAVYISYASIFTDPQGIAAVGPELQALWQSQRQAFAVVTDREVAAGAVRLADFRAIYPLNGAGDPALAAYARAGGHVVQSPAQLLRYAPAYASLSPAAPAVEVVPSVDAAQHTAWLTIAATSATAGYRGRLTIDSAGLGLPPGRYRLVDVTTGRPVATAGGSLTVEVTLTPGTLDLWRMDPVSAVGGS